MANSCFVFLAWESKNMNTVNEAIELIERILETKVLNDYAVKSDEIEDIERAWNLIKNNLR
jgi:hypothetical protein